MGNMSLSALSMFGAGRMRRNRAEDQVDPEDEKAVDPEEEDIEAEGTDPDEEGEQAAGVDPDDDDQAEGEDEEDRPKASALSRSVARAKSARSKDYRKGRADGIARERRRTASVLSSLDLDDKAKAAAMLLATGNASAGDIKAAIAGFSGRKSGASALEKAMAAQGNPAIGAAPAGGKRRSLADGMKKMHNLS